jgi:hypothetical protein
VRGAGEILPLWLIGALMMMPGRLRAGGLSYLRVQAPWMPARRRSLALHLQDQQAALAKQPNKLQLSVCAFIVSYYGGAFCLKQNKKVSFCSRFGRNHRRKKKANKAIEGPALQQKKKKAAYQYVGDKKCQAR